MEGVTAEEGAIEEDDWRCRSRRLRGPGRAPIMYVASSADKKAFTKFTRLPLGFVLLSITLYVQSFVMVSSIFASAFLVTLTWSSIVSRWNTNSLFLPNIRNWLDALISLMMSALIWKLVSGDRKTGPTSGLESYTLPEVGGALSLRSFPLLDLLVEGSVPVGELLLLQPRQPFCPPTARQIEPGLNSFWD